MVLNFVLHMTPIGVYFFFVVGLGRIAMQVPNREHNSGKPAKRRLKPQAVRARKRALKALKRKLGAS